MLPHVGSRYVIGHVTISHEWP